MTSFERHGCRILRTPPRLLYHDKKVALASLDSCDRDTYVCIFYPTHLQTIYAMLGCTTLWVSGHLEFVLEAYLPKADRSQVDNFVVRTLRSVKSSPLHSQKRRDKPSVVV